MAKLAFPEGYTFDGFEMPQYTPVPDVVFDYFLPRLNGSELKVLLYIIRRTLGFKKSRDDISLRQLVDGITTRDGRILDEGTGLSMPSVVSAVQSLVDKQIVTARRNSSPERGHEATTYALNLRGDGTTGVGGDSAPSTPDGTGGGGEGGESVGGHSVSSTGRTAAPFSTSGDTGGSAAASSSDESADKSAGKDASSGEANPASTDKQGETPYLNNLSRATKETLEGHLKKLKTQETVVQETEQQEDVVAALTQRGIYEKVAKKLAHKYPAERVREKVGIHDWLKRRNPRALSRNAAGWLVRAIEGDWPPPRSYVADREEASPPVDTTNAEALATSLHNVGEVASAPGAVHSPERQTEQPPPDAPPQIVAWWDAAYESLELELPRDTFNTWLRDAVLVAGRQADGRVEVRIGLRNIYARSWLDTRLVKPVARELSRLAKQEVAVTFVKQAREHFLRARRRELGMSQAALARRLKADGAPLSASSISAWERGVRVPRLDAAAIRALAGALDWGEARLRLALGS
jgi:DNA-binding transcriptional regulator YiaG